MIPVSVSAAMGLPSMKILIRCKSGLVDFDLFCTFSESTTPDRLSCSGQLVGFTPLI